MWQVPTVVWNEIARTQKLRTKWAKRVFPMEPIEMLETLDKEMEKLEKEKKVDGPVALAYMKIAPLLMENVAISRYIQMKNAQHLRAALPEVLTAEEATMLASREVVLTPAQLRQIYSLMKEIERDLVKDQEEL